MAQDVAPRTAVPVALPATEPGAAAASPLQLALAANDLQGKGKKPYHLTVEFQVMDFSGAPQEKGSAEVWWAGPDGAYLTITSPSVGTVHDTDTTKLPSDQARRVLFLVNQLLTAIQRPALMVSEGAHTSTAPKTLGSVSLTCITAPEGGPMQGQVIPLSSLCVDDANGTIRLLKKNMVQTTRNHVASFAGTKLAEEVTQQIVGRMAIEGRVTELRSFDPAHAPVTLKRAKQDAATSDAVSSGAAVTQGRLVKYEKPDYPEIAKRSRVSGSVILAAQINAAGKVTDPLTGRGGKPTADCVCDRGSTGLGLPTVSSG